MSGLATPACRMRRRCTYAATFNKFYSVICKRKTQTFGSTKLASVHTWVRHTVLHPRRRISDRIRITRHLLLIRDTQQAGTHIDTDTHNMIVGMQRSLTVGWIRHHLRPLQRRIVQYLWRPGGPLYRRHRDELFRSMRDVGLVDLG